MGRNLGQQPFCLVRTRIAEKHSLKPQAAAQGLLQNADSLNRGVSIRCCFAVGKGLAELFDQRIMAACLMRRKRPVNVHCF